MRRFFGLSLLVFCVFTVTFMVTFLMVLPSPSTKVPVVYSVGDYLLLGGLWGVCVGVVYSLGRRVGRVKLSKLLDTVAAGLASLMLSIVMLIVTPKLTGSPTGYPMDLLYVLPVLLAVIVGLCWLSNRIEPKKEAAA